MPTGEKQKIQAAHSCQEEANADCGVDKQIYTTTVVHMTAFAGQFFPQAFGHVNHPIPVQTQVDKRNDNHGHTRPGMQ